MKYCAGTVTVTVMALAMLAQAAQGAEDADREAYIVKIEATYMKTTVLSRDSPFIRNLLESAKAANPGVADDVWSKVGPEVAEAVFSVMSEKDGVIDSTLRSSLSAMSTSELKRLSELLADPVLVKFSAANAAPSTQQQFVRALQQNGAKMEAAINKVLTGHGLKGVH